MSIHRRKDDCLIKFNVLAELYIGMSKILIMDKNKSWISLSKVIVISIISVISVFEKREIVFEVATFGIC